MSANIHPYLLARLIAVQQAFNQPGFGIPVPRIAPAPISTKQGNNWRDVVKEQAKDGDEGQAGGRGSQRGLRGKNAELAKQSMRKLSRR